MDTMNRHNGLRLQMWSQKCKSNILVLLDALLLLLGLECSNEVGLSEFSFKCFLGFVRFEDCAILYLFGYVAGEDFVGDELISSGNVHVVSAKQNLSP